METLHQLMTEQLQTLCLAIGLLLSCVLPVMVKLMEPPGARTPRPWMRTVWKGQGFIALGGLLIVGFPAHPLLGLVVAVASCIVFAFKLRRDLPMLRAVQRS